MGSGITLTNKEIKDIIKVIKFMGKRGTLLEETTKKVIKQKGKFLGLPLPFIDKT